MWNKANALQVQQIADIQNFAQAPETSELANFECKPEGILAVREADAHAPKAVYRQAGDSYILLEYGENVLDLALRLRVYRLMQLIREAKIDGILELSPGVRSLQIKYDGLRFSQANLIQFLIGFGK